MDEDMAGFLHWKPPDRSPCYSSGWCAPIKDASKVHQAFHYGAVYSEEYGNLAGVAHPGEDIFSDQQPLDEDIGIYAIGSGKVVKNQYEEGYGNYVMIEHNLPEGKKAYSLYAHMADLPDLEVGTIVGGGQRIGAMGHTGNSDDGDHLHFWVRKVTAKSWKGSGIDDDPKVVPENVDTWWYSPYDFLRDRGVVIDW